MSAPRGGTFLVTFEGDPPPSTVRSLLRTLRIPREPSGDVRWHGPRFVTLTSRRSLSRDVREGLGAQPGVEAVQCLPAGGRLVRGDGPLRAHSRVELPGGVVIGAGAPTVFAGPCSVEGAEQVRVAAEAVAAAGARVLRGGVFKARSSPYSFGGLAEAGLEYLAAARAATGLPIVTEALQASDLDVVSRTADMIQIGSRNMQNFPFLFAAGAHASGLPILLKRGLAATISEFLLAAEYVLLGRVFAGHAEAGLVLCERGIRTFNDATRFTLDLGAIPVIQQRCALPVIVDPSHAAGSRPLVAPLARAALAAGAEGLLVEVHPDPARALCDGAQSLTPAEFRELMQDLQRFAAPPLRRETPSAFAASSPGGIS